MKLPEHIAQRFVYQTQVMIPTEYLFVSFLTELGVRRCKVTETPHYEYIMGYFEQNSSLTKDYLLYNTEFLRRPENMFHEFIVEWDQFGLDLQSFPIIAYQFTEQKYLVLDGFHRLAFATYKKIENVNVLVTRKRSILSRLIRKLKYE